MKARVKDIRRKILSFVNWKHLVIEMRGREKSSIYIWRNKMYVIFRRKRKKSQANL